MILNIFKQGECVCSSGVACTPDCSPNGMNGAHCNDLYTVKLNLTLYFLFIYLALYFFFNEISVTSNAFAKGHVVQDVA
jgi:hypothetical protein